MTGCVLAMMLLCANPENEMIDYFFKYQHSNGCVQDRSSKQMYSCAAAGFAMDVYAIAFIKNIISVEDCNNRIRAVLKFYSKTPPENRGWLFHFQYASGEPAFNREISTIDTAIFYQGARQASHRLKNHLLSEEVETLIKKIDQQWMIKNERFCHGRINNQFIKHEWDDYNEGILIYNLFGRPYKPKKITYDLPLFVYYYPRCFIHNNPALVNHLKRAINYQKETFGYIGITSCDTREGYRTFPTDYISPLALYSIAPFYPNQTKYPIVGSIHLKSNWKSQDCIGIDEGAAILLHNIDFFKNSSKIGE